MKMRQKNRQWKASPNCIYSLEDDKLGLLGKALLVRLAHLAFDLDEIFISNATLARDLNVSVRSIVNGIHELEERGYIRRLQKHQTGTKVTELCHETIIARLFEKPRSNRHLAWLTNYYSMPKKVRGRY